MAKINNITIKALGENSFDIRVPKKKRDCHLRKEGRQWMVHIFNSNIRNDDKALLESTPVNGNRNGPDWNDVIGYLQAIWLDFSAKLCDIYLVWKGDSPNSQPSVPFGNPFPLQLALRGRWRVVAIGEGFAMDNCMAKRIENDENLKKYKARMEELKREGELLPSPQLPDDALIRHLAAEGTALLKAECKDVPTKVVGKIQPKKTDEVKLTDALGLTSKNPYIRARIMVLKKFPAWRRSEIGTMEQNGDTDNKFYLEFVKAVAELGDQLST